MRKIDFIDFGKGYAITTIVFYHYLQKYDLSKILEQAINFGGTGIHLFFFLSGFGLNLRKVGSYKKFLKRKFIKILLPYYILVTIAYLLNFITPLYQEFGLYAYLGHIFLFKMFDNEIIGSFGYHLWFISTLIQFYLIFPFLQMLNNKIGSYSFFIVCVLCSNVYWIILHQLEMYHFRSFNSFFLQYLWEFGLGIAAASLYKRKGIEFWKINLLGATIIGVVSLGIMGFIIIHFGEAGKIFNDIPAFFAYTALTIIVYWAMKKAFSPGFYFFLRMSKYSYSLYLIHFIIIQICFLMWNNTNMKILPLHLFLYIFVVILFTFLFKKGTFFIKNNLIEDARN